MKGFLKLFILALTLFVMALLLYARGAYDKLIFPNANFDIWFDLEVALIFVLGQYFLKISAKKKVQREAEKPGTAIVQEFKKPSDISFSHILPQVILLIIAFVIATILHKFIN